MGLAHSPNIVTNGLVMCLDAANPKSLLSSVEVLVVAAGGGSGGGGSTGYHGGGGGGGGVVVHPSLSITPASSVTVTVGVGGIAGVQTGDSGFKGGNGGNSVFGALTANGGGGGGGNSAPGGAAGGSGGGGNLYAGAGGASNQPSYTGATVFGNAGGAGQATYGSGGGGGGAGSAGGTGASNVGGSGGQGIFNSISGTDVYYGGGGAAAGNSVNGTAINGAAAAYTAGAANIGQGAGGRQSVAGLAGGSGIVIVRYPGPQRATGGTITSVNGDTVHTFTSSGTFTPNIITNVRGNGNDGTLVNGAGYNSANKGSLVLDGVNDYATIPFNSNFNVTSNPFTVIVWNRKNTSTNGYNGLITADLAGDTTWKIFKDINEAFYKSRAGSTVLSFPGYTVNQWHQYAFTKSGTSLINYFDGQPVNSTASATNPTSFSNDLALGSYRLNDATAGGFLMNQNFSQILFYNRALSAAEIQQNFNALKGRYGL